jgi:hypothetical protein
MNLDLRYLGHSGVVPSGGGVAVKFAPNLARPKVFFDGEVQFPLRFREAMSALHDVVIGDLRFKKKDKTAYEAWKQQQANQEVQLQQAVYRQVREAEMKKATGEVAPADLEPRFRKMHDLYWTARRRWASELSSHDPELFRHLVPCDPVVTVAPDVVFFECFAKDESSYGCLSVDRNAFKTGQDAGLGTTNVDYSIALFEHFQTLRTYRTTRLLVDPSGFEVKVEDAGDYREEKIDLPPSWLKGFGQIQSAVALPARQVSLSVEAVYSVLAFLKRHREKGGPRSIRFKLVPGQAPVLVLDPWGIVITSHGTVYEGDKPEEIKVWGRRRLMSLARLLPIAEKFEVRLLGSGMPSVWVAHLGEMRFNLALSGWTTNDWTSGANLDLLGGFFDVDRGLVSRLEKHLETARMATLPELEAFSQRPREAVLSALNTLAKQGQVIFDFAVGVYRYRPIMPVALSEAVLGLESPELVAARNYLAQKRVKVTRDDAVTGNKRLVMAKVDNTACEGLLDADGVLGKAKCNCSFFHTQGLKAGPCRHLMAMQLALKAAVAPPWAAPLAKMVLAVPAAAPAPVATVTPITSAPSAPVPPAPVAPRPTLVPAPSAGSMLSTAAPDAERRKVTLFVAPETEEAWEERSARLDKSVATLLEVCWMIAQDRIKQAATLEDLRLQVFGSAKAPVRGDPVKRQILLPMAMADALEQAADRLNCSVSALFELVWAVGRQQLGK